MEGDTWVPSHWSAYLCLHHCRALCAEGLHGLEHVNHTLIPHAFQGDAQSDKHSGAAHTSTAQRMAVSGVLSPPVGVPRPSEAPSTPALHGTAPPHLQCTVMGPSCPNCSFVLCTCPMKSMKPSPVLGTPCSGQSVNWNCRIVLDCPSWERWSGARVKVCTSGTRPSRHRDALTRTLRGNTHSLYSCSLSSRGLGADPDSHEVR